MPTQQVRALLAWMDKDEAVQLQLGMRIPAPGEDTAVQVARWEAARQQMQARAEYAEPTPALEPLPAELQERGQALMQRPEIVAAFEGHAWTVGIADLRQLLSYPEVGFQRRGGARAAALDGADWQALFSFCLPVEGGPLPMPATVDPDGKGIAFSSPNPKLRVDGSTFATVNGQPFFGFRISFGLPFVQVVEYRERWFLQDGYHRCYGLLRRGIAHVPCIFIHAREGRQFGGAAPGFFRAEVLFGARPPFLRDLLDDEVSVTANKAITGKGFASARRSSMCSCEGGRARLQPCRKVNLPVMLSEHGPRLAARVETPLYNLHRVRWYRVLRLRSPQRPPLRMTA